MNKIEIGSPIDITYISERNGGKISHRKIIPITVPEDIVRAIDITYDNEAQRKQLLNAVQEYTNYRNLAINRLHSFEDFIQLTEGKQETPSINWRAFKLSGITIS